MYVDVPRQKNDNLTFDLKYPEMCIYDWLLGCPDFEFFSQIFSQ